MYDILLRISVAMMTYQDQKELGVEGTCCIYTFTSLSLEEVRTETNVEKEPRGRS